jgi:hypothetical protein
MVILVSPLGRSTFRLYLLSRRRAPPFSSMGTPHNAAATTAPRLFFSESILFASSDLLLPWY